MSLVEEELPSTDTHRHTGINTRRGVTKGIVNPHITSSVIMQLKHLQVVNMGIFQLLSLLCLIFPGFSSMRLNIVGILTHTHTLTFVNTLQPDMHTQTHRTVKRSRHTHFPSKFFYTPIYRGGCTRMHTLSHTFYILNSTSSSLPISS